MAATKEKKLGVAEAAKTAKRSPVYVRLKLRDANIKKTGRSYSWTNKEAMVKDLKRAEIIAA